jgi:hypothetical protein
MDCGFRFCLGERGLGCISSHLCRFTGCIEFGPFLCHVYACEVVAFLLGNPAFDNLLLAAWEMLQLSFRVQGYFFAGWKLSFMWCAIPQNNNLIQTFLSFRRQTKGPVKHNELASFDCTHPAGDPVANQSL